MVVHNILIAMSLNLLGAWAYATEISMPSRFRSFCERILVDNEYLKPSDQAQLLETNADVATAGNIVLVQRKGERSFTRFNRTARGIEELTIFEKFYPPEFFYWDQLKGKKILDLACGEGVLVEELRREGIEAIGLDIMLSKYMKSRPYYVRASVERTGFPSESFDIIYSTQGPLFYLDDNSTVMREILVEAHRILKPGGILRISTIAYEGNLSRTGARPEKDLAGTVYTDLPAGLRLRSWPNAHWFATATTDDYDQVHYWLEIERVD